MQLLKSATVAILKRFQFGTFELLHGFSNFLWLNNYFLSLMKKSGYKVVQKVSQTLKNPRFGLIQRVNLSFLGRLSTEFSFFNFSDILTSPRMPGNQNQKLLIFLALLSKNSHSVNFLHELFYPTYPSQSALTY